MHEALQSRDDIGRAFVTRGLASIEDSVNASIQWLKDDREKREGLITATRNDADNTKNNENNNNLKR